MRKRKIKINMSDFPPQLRGILEAGTVYDSSCHSNAQVLYCDGGFYIKTDEKGSLASEAALARLFYGMGLGVEVVDYISFGRDYLVTREAAGEDATHWRQDPERLCEVLAQALRTLHSQDAGNAPMSSRLQRYLDSAGGSISGGCYDESVRMERFWIGSREEAWEIMQANKHRLKNDTLIHGDACLPNIVLKDWQFSCFIDFNMAGAGDRHIDLYWALWSLNYNLKTDRYTDLFLDLYGRENFDSDMLKVVAAFELFG